jgi:hypothetical protein
LRAVLSGRSAPARGSAALASGWAIRIGYTYQMHLTSAPYLLPITSLLAGLFLLLAPRVVSFAAAVYLIFVGLLGLNGIYHLFK